MSLFNFSGGCCGSRQKKTRVGGWAWAWWLVTDVQRLSLEVHKSLRSYTCIVNNTKAWAKIEVEGALFRAKAKLDLRNLIFAYLSLDQQYS